MAIILSLEQHSFKLDLEFVEPNEPGFERDALLTNIDDGVRYVSRAFVYCGSEWV